MTAQNKSNKFDFLPTINTDLSVELQYALRYNLPTKVLKKYQRSVLKSVYLQDKYQNVI